MHKSRVFIFVLLVEIILFFLARYIRTEALHNLDCEPNAGCVLGPLYTLPTTAIGFVLAVTIIGFAVSLVISKK